MGNATPLGAGEFDREIENSVPYYGQFYQQTIDLVAALEMPKLKWLDTGCGTGQLVALAAPRFPEARFYLCDPAPEMIETARQKLQHNAQVVEISIYGSQEIAYQEEFDVITAIQSHHYFQRAEREEALKKCHQALTAGGVFVTFENYAPGDTLAREIALKRWGNYQRVRGKSEAVVAEHLDRYAKNYFPIPVAEHLELLKDVGFRTAEILWLSYMQVGLYAAK